MNKTIIDYAIEGDLENVKRLADGAEDWEILWALRYSAEEGRLKVVKYLSNKMKERSKS